MAVLTGIERRRIFLRFSLWTRRVARKLAIGLASAALISGIATYLALTGGAVFGHVFGPQYVIALLTIDMILLLLLFIVVARKLVNIWMGRRTGAAGSRLHGRMVLLFGFVAATPTILVAIFSAVFFHFGLQAWFSDHVRMAVTNSLVVAEAYLEEHQKIIGTDALAISQAINKEGAVSLTQNPAIKEILETRVVTRGLNEAVIFDDHGRVLANAGYTLSLQFENVPFWALQKAAGGEVAILTSEAEDRVRALVRLDHPAPIFLYVGRFVDESVIAHIDKAKAAVTKYEKLEGQRSQFEITFSLIFMLGALLLLLAAVWFGLTVATQITRPVIALITAAGKIRDGDLTVRVEEQAYADELSVLSRAFNRMTGQLESQRTRLIETNREVDERRRFMETVLSGVSAGIVALDAAGKIRLANRAARAILQWDEKRQKRGAFIKDVLPTFGDAFDHVQAKPDKVFTGEISLSIEDGEVRSLLVRLAAERQDDDVLGFVFTFDDITERLEAQRKAAWADIARRIAHEIKNPLTPIQLSAERLRRKYEKQITEDADTFVLCTDTIVKHVTDIGRMVDEFSNFARMPAPVMKNENLNRVIEEAFFLQKTAFPQIDFALDLPKEPIRFECDRRQLTQVLTNIIKNAVESIDQTPEEGGNISCRLSRADDVMEISIEDNGIGLPADNRHRLTEPYVTTRSKGTGLGLAIVKKIMEDHHGALRLEDRKEGGARVRLLFVENA